MTSTDLVRPDVMIQRYQNEFAAVLPSHIKPEQFVRLAVGALRRDPKLMQAATQNPASLMHALLEASRLGLEPGTPEFYLTPRFGRDPGVLGITGYRGEVELIYRAGAVSSVKAEVVYERDRFDFRPDMDKPVHEVDWFADRGRVLGAYAYAEMVGGGVPMVAAGPIGAAARGTSLAARGVRGVAGALTIGETGTVGQAALQSAKIGGVYGGLSGSGHADVQPDDTMSEALLKRGKGALSQGRAADIADTNHQNRADLHGSFVR